MNQFLVEARQAGDRLIGEVVYNREALDRAEMFTPSAFSSVADPLELRLQHDRVRQPVASTEKRNPGGGRHGYQLEAGGPLTARLGEHQLVARGALGGLSVEFVAKTETRNRAGVRIITDAHLDGIGLVDMGQLPVAGRTPQGVVPGYDPNPFGNVLSVPRPGV